ncbi:head-tail connector protein [Bacillus paralicheniformis]|uniref:head-tail connector protein n=1 Tax=Bacillus paralicheniformis TaxID=1648923 RepID=UPI001E29BDC4|nr:head-tail connector protein [Bacillus paralicheniformis]MCB6219088.1 head-tail connector protein [Bacillus paralicheniformis]
MNLVDMKNYLRLDHSEDDQMLTQFIAAAKSYIVNAIGRFVDGSPQFEIVAHMLVAHWYENRGMYESGTTGSSIPFTVENLLTQLRYTDDEVQEDEEKEGQRSAAPPDIPKEDRDSG